jgi:hypothetical protein
MTFNVQAEAVMRNHRMGPMGCSFTRSATVLLHFLTAKYGLLHSFLILFKHTYRVKIITF